MAGFNIDVDKWLQESDDGQQEHLAGGATGGEYISLDDFAKSMKNIDPTGSSSQKSTNAPNHAYTEVTEGTRKIYKCNYCSTEDEEEYKVFLHCSQYHVDQDFHNVVTSMDSLENRLLKESLLEKSGPTNTHLPKLNPGQMPNDTNNDSDSDSDMHIIRPRVNSAQTLTKNSSESISVAASQSTPLQSLNIPKSSSIPTASKQSSTPALKESNHSEVQQKSNSQATASCVSTANEGEHPQNTAISSRVESRVTAPLSTSTGATCRPDSRNEHRNSIETRIADRSSADKIVRNPSGQNTNSNSSDSLPIPVLDIHIPTPPALIPDNTSENKDGGEDLDALVLSKTAEALKKNSGTWSMDIPDFGKNSSDVQRVNMNPIQQPVPVPPQQNAPQVANQGHSRTDQRQPVNIPPAANQPTSWGSVMPSFQSKTPPLNPSKSPLAMVPQQAPFQNQNTNNGAGYFTNLLASCTDQAQVGQPMSMSQPMLNGSSLHAIASMPSPLGPPNQVAPPSTMSFTRSQSFTSHPSLQQVQVSQMQSPPPMYGNSGNILPQMLQANSSRTQTISTGYIQPAQIQRQNSGPARLQGGTRMPGTSQTQMLPNQSQMMEQQQMRQIAPHSAQMQQSPAMPQQHASQPRMNNPESRQQMGQRQTTPQQVNQQRPSNPPMQQMLYQQALNQATMPNSVRGVRPAILRNSRNQTIQQQLYPPQSVQNIRPGYNPVTFSSAGLRQVNTTQFQNVQPNHATTKPQNQNPAKRQTHAILSQALQKATTTPARAPVPRAQNPQNARNVQLQQFNVMRSTATGNQQNVFQYVFPGTPGSQTNANSMIRQGIPQNILPPGSGSQEQFQNSLRQSAPPQPSFVSAGSTNSKKNSQDGKLFIMKQIGEGFVLTPYAGTPAVSQTSALPATKQISLGTLQNLKGLNSRPDLMAYLNGKAVPPDIKFKCKLCNAKTNNPNMMRWHLYAYHLNSAPLPLRCLKCPEMFSTENLALDHCIKKHNSNSKDCYKFDESIPPIAQNYSIEMFKIFTDIIQESIQKNAEPDADKPKPSVVPLRYECRVCLAVETNYERMKKHMENSHNPFKVDLFQCWYCPEHANTEAAIKKHVSAAHSSHPIQYARDMPPGHKRSKITERLVEFIRKLTPDMTTLKTVTLSEPQPQKPDKTEIIQCPLCSFIALQIFVLESHVKNDHLPFQPYICHGKDYKAATVKDLKAHLTKAHTDWLKAGFLHKKVSIDGEMASCQERETKNYLERSLVKGLEFKLKTDPDPSEAPFDLQCVKCFFKTNNHRSLEVHIRLRHLCYTPYICRICGTCTVLKETLVNHIKEKHPTEPVEDMLFTDQTSENNQEEETNKLMVECVCHDDNDEFIDDNGVAVPSDVPARQGSVEQDLANQLLEGTTILSGAECRSTQSPSIQVTESLPAANANVPAAPTVTNTVASSAVPTSAGVLSSAATYLTTASSSSVVTAATTTPSRIAPGQIVLLPASTSASRVIGTTLTSPTVLTSPSSVTPIVLTPTTLRTSQPVTTSINGMGTQQIPIPVTLTNSPASIQIRPMQMPLMFIPVGTGVQSFVRPGTSINTTTVTSTQTISQTISGLRPILPSPASGTCTVVIPSPTSLTPSRVPAPRQPQPASAPQFIVTSQASSQAQASVGGVRIKEEPGLAEPELENEAVREATPVITESADAQDSDVVQISSDSNDTQDTALVVPPTERGAGSNSSPEAARLRQGTEKEKSLENGAGATGNDGVVLSIPNMPKGSDLSMVKITSLFTGEQLNETLAEPLNVIPKPPAPPPPAIPGTSSQNDSEPDMDNFEKAFQCHMCEEIFAKMWTLRQHCIAVHFIEHWPFYCASCNFRSWSHPIMKEHMRNVHNVAESVKVDRKRQAQLQEKLQDMWKNVKNLLVPKTSVSNSEADKSKKKTQAPVVSASISDIQKKLKVRNKKSKRDSSKERNGKTTVKSPPLVKISPADRRRTIEKAPEDNQKSNVEKTCFLCERFKEGTPVEVNLPLVYITPVSTKECTIRCHCEYTSQNISEFVFHIWSHTNLRLYHCGLCLEEGNEKKVIETHCRTKHQDEVELHRIRLFKSVVKLLQQHLEFVVGKLHEFSSKNVPLPSDRDDQDVTDVKKIIYLCPFCDYKNLSVLNLIHHEKKMHSVRMMKVTLDFRASMDFGPTERVFKTKQPLDRVTNVSNSAESSFSKEIKDNEASVSAKVVTDKENKAAEAEQEPEKHIKMKLNLKLGKRKAQILSESSSDSDTSSMSNCSRKRKNAKHGIVSDWFVCHMCEFKCKNVHELENHLLEQHTCIRPYRCGKCKKNYLIKDKVREHIIRRHANSDAKLIINKQMEIIMEKARKGLMKNAMKLKESSRRSKRIRLADSDAESTSSVEIVHRGRKRKRRESVLNDPKLKMRPVVVLKDIAKSKKKRYRKIVEAYNKMIKRKNKKS